MGQKTPTQFVWAKRILAPSALAVNRRSQPPSISSPACAMLRIDRAGLDFFANRVQLPALCTPAWVESRQPGDARRHSSAAVAGSLEPCAPPRSLNKRARRAMPPEPECESAPVRPGGRRIQSSMAPFTRLGDVDWIGSRGVGAGLVEARLPACSCMLTATERVSRLRGRRQQWAATAVRGRHGGLETPQMKVGDPEPLAAEADTQPFGRNRIGLTLGVILTVVG